MRHVRDMSDADYRAARAEMIRAADAQMRQALSSSRSSDDPPLAPVRRAAEMTDAEYRAARAELIRRR